jgi:hypothetical protein
MAVAVEAQRPLFILREESFGEDFPRVKTESALE